MSLDGVQVHLVDSVDAAGDLMRWLGDEGPARRGMIGYDTESTGLSPETDRIRLVQIGDDRVGWAIPFERWGGVVEDLVARWDGLYAMHNAPFDVAMSEAEGIEIPRHRVHDTRLAGHVREPTQSTALKNQASRHVDARAGALQRQLDEVMSRDGWTWATIPIEAEGPASIYWKYGAIDPVLAIQLWDHHGPSVHEEAPLAYQIELGAAWVVERMERRGAKIDREFTEERSKEFTRYVDDVEAWCRENYGVGPGQTDRVVEVLQADGVELTKRTKSGAKLSLDKEVLESLDHPLARQVLSRRRVQKLQSTYLRRFLEHSEHDGLLHPHINSIGGSGKSAGATEGLYGVRTGRMSMDSPNLQQLPRRSTSSPLAEVIRDCVVPRDERHTLIMCDFDQIEMRVLAHLSADPRMVELFRNPDVDFFTEMARQVYNDPHIEKADLRRQVSKSAGYAKAYGAGAEKFSETAGITFEEGLSFLGTFDRLYPGVRRFQQQVQNDALARLTQTGVAYVTSPLTGRRHVADRDKEYALVNYEIQGLAAEILKLKLLELDAAGLGDFMILPVHDEVILDVPNEHVPWAIETTRAVMNDDRLLTVPITASVSHGRRWGSKVELGPGEVVHP